MTVEGPVDSSRGCLNVRTGSGHELFRFKEMTRKGATHGNAQEVIEIYFGVLRNTWGKR